MCHNRWETICNKVPGLSTAATAVWDTGTFYVIYGASTWLFRRNPTQGEPSPATIWAPLTIACLSSLVLTVRRVRHNNRVRDGQQTALLAKAEAPTVRHVISITAAAILYSGLKAYAKGKFCGEATYTLTPAYILQTLLEELGETAESLGIDPTTFAESVYAHLPDGAQQVDGLTGIQYTRSDWCEIDLNTIPPLFQPGVKALVDQQTGLFNNFLSNVAKPVAVIHGIAQLARMGIQAFSSLVSSSSAGSRNSAGHGIPAQSQPLVSTAAGGALNGYGATTNTRNGTHGGGRSAFTLNLSMDSDNDINDGLNDALGGGSDCGAAAVAAHSTPAAAGGGGGNGALVFNSVDFYGSGVATPATLQDDGENTGGNVPIEPEESSSSSVGSIRMGKSSSDS